MKKVIRIKDNPIKEEKPVAKDIADDPEDTILYFDEDEEETEDKNLKRAAAPSISDPTQLLILSQTQKVNLRKKVNVGAEARIRLTSATEDNIIPNGDDGNSNTDDSNSNIQRHYSMPEPVRKTTIVYL